MHVCLKAYTFLLLLCIRKMVAKVQISLKHVTLNSEYDIYEIIRAFPYAEIFKIPF